MRIYSVHAPAMERSGAGMAADRHIFVRDGFHFAAFLFGPFWLAARRLWLALAAYVALMASASALLHMAGRGDLMMYVWLLAALLLGLEAGNLRRWTLNRRGAGEVAVVTAETQEAAERRFFDHWQAGQGARPSPPPAPTTPGAPPAGVIGLFPQAGASL